MCFDRFAAALSRTMIARRDARPALRRRLARLNAGSFGLRCVQIALVTASPSLVWAAAPQFPDASSQGQPGIRITEITADVQTLYDSNVARGDAAIAAQRGLAPADVRVQPAASFDLLRPIGRQSIFLKGLVGYDFYGRDKILNHGRIDVSGGFDARVGQCTGVATASYVEHQSNLEDLGVAAITKNIQDSKLIDFNADCARQIGFTPTFGVSQTDVTNSASREVSDFDTFAINGGVEYRNPVFGNLSLFGQYDSTRFPDRPISSPAARSYKVYSGGVQYDRHLGGRVEASFEVAYTSLRPDLAGAVGFNGLTFTLSATARVSPRITVKLNAERETRPSIQTDSAFSREDTYLGELSYDPNSNLKLTAGVSQLGRRFGGAVVNGALTNETINSVFAEAHLQVAPRLSLVLDVRQEKRDANVTSLHYVSNRVGLTAVARF